MIKQPSVTAGVVRDALESMPHAGSRTLARFLHKEHPKLFPTVDKARQVIRYYRGTSGKDNLKGRRGDIVPRLAALEMPESVAEKRPFFDVAGPAQVLVMSDIHFPYHDKGALEAAVMYAVKRKPDIVYLNGDTVENYGVSRWEPDPRKRDVARELKLSRQGLEFLRNKFPKARLIFKHGNHEDRWESFMIKNAPAVLGVEDFLLSRLLRFDSLGIEEVGSRQVATLGKLMLVHGHEMPKGMNNPVNPARGLFLRMNETSMCGHFHQTSQHSDSSGIRKNLVSCWSTGSLCDLSPDYAICNRWNHGFAWVSIERGGEFNVDNLKIIHGKVY